VCVRAIFLLSNLDAAKSTTLSKACVASINEHPTHMSDVNDFSWPTHIDVMQFIFTSHPCDMYSCPSRYAYLLLNI
jgi:hypothetical protein